MDAAVNKKYPASMACIFVATNLRGNLNMRTRPGIFNFPAKQFYTITQLSDCVCIIRVYALRVLISASFTRAPFLIICTQSFMQTNPVIVGSVLYRVAGRRGRGGGGH